jgi:diguanylate cyclase (GGDEF)-like protein
LVTHLFVEVCDQGTWSCGRGKDVERWWLVLVVCGVLALPTAVQPGSTTAEVTYLIGLAIVVTGVWAGSRACLGAARRAWTLIALASSCWLVGDLVQRMSEITETELEVGPSDAFWLGSYPLLVAGVILMIRARGLRHDVLREIQLDVVAVTVAAFVGAWQMMIAPAISEGSVNLYTVATVLYPLGDVAIFALALTLVLAPGVRGTASALLIACLGSTLLLDLIYSIDPAWLPQFNADRLDAVLLIVNGLLAAAALHPRRDELVEKPPVSGRSEHMHRWRVMLLGVALAAVSVAAAMSSNLATNRILLAGASLIISAAIMLRFYGVIRDREQAELALAHQASHDQLTGLANRGLLLDRIGGALFVPIGQPIRDFVLFYIDLDGFKKINDTYGHAAGDEVLRAVSQRLQRLTRAGDTVARLGGDEFVVLCLDSRADAAEEFGQRIRDKISGSIVVGVTELHVGASIGVLVAADIDQRHKMDADQILQSADVAMYVAKRQGGGVRISQPEADSELASPAPAALPVGAIPAPRLPAVPAPTSGLPN